jgi:isocitrate/isopropylmalate dehydrogenase
MMLEYLGYTEAGLAIEEAVQASIASRDVTRDLGGTLSTVEAGAQIRQRI